LYVTIFLFTLFSEERHGNSSKWLVFNQHNFILFLTPTLLLLLLLLSSSSTTTLSLSRLLSLDFPPGTSALQPNVISDLTFRRRNYFFLILAHPVYKMWIKQEPNVLELWNKLHFEEKKKRRVCTMFKIFSTCICWINIWNATFRY